MTWVFVAVGVVVSAVAWRLRHPEPVARRSTGWVAIWVAVNTAVIVAGHLLASAASGRSGVVSIASLVVTLPSLLVGVGENPEGKRRPNFRGNAFTRKLDALVLDRNRAAHASNRDAYVDLLMCRSSEPCKLSHVSLDEYVRYAGKDLVLQRRVRSIARSQISTVDKLDALIGLVDINEHWQFLGEQCSRARRARRRTRRSAGLRRRNRG